MARFNCIPPVTGNLGPVVIYQMHGRYFMRTTSSLTRERVKKDPAFRRTRELAGQLAKASRMASAVYALVPAARKEKGLYRQLTGEAMYWLCNNWTEADVMEYLQRMYLRPAGIRLATAKAPVVAKAIYQPEKKQQITANRKKKATAKRKKKSTHTTQQRRYRPFEAESLDQYLLRPGRVEAVESS